ncbi:hypothetical protein [Cupriavidus campinensis]|uniref:Uncharacterized protein n=1 Tax=Cupriavidus campinensis TaxID=151783 RepID=A0ABY3ESP6_9BURK|nr:hypothetical protein [Cupriavidus campinensis]TSP13994.1 hypothetical protein FGG12_05855 [Cupriavidus campinensis]
MVTDEKAPGCFGAASVFSHDSKVCRACLAFEGCGQASIATLERIQSMMDVRDLLKRHEKAKAKFEAEHAAAPVPPAAEGEGLPERQEREVPVERKTRMTAVNIEVDEESQTVIARIGNKKARDQAIALCKANMIDHMRAALASNENPFAERGPGFLRVFCDLLLCGPFTRSQYRERLKADLSWSDGSANSHCAIAQALMTTFGFAAMSGETFQTGA